MGGGSSSAKCEHNSTTLAIKSPCVVHFCSCGLTSAHPYCDNSHIESNLKNGTEYVPYMVSIKEPAMLMICECGNTEKHPFCTNAELQADVAEEDPCNYSMRVDVEEAGTVMCVIPKPGRVRLYEPRKSLWAQYPSRPRREGPMEMTTRKGATYIFCACGQSATLPICDGAHTRYNAEHMTELRPFFVSVDEAKTVFICACGLSDNKPYCDGSHMQLRNPTLVVSEDDKSVAIQSSASTANTSSGVREVAAGFGVEPVAVELSEIIPLTVNVFCYRFTLPDGVELDTRLGCDVWVRFYTDDGEEVTRPYTPIQPVTRDGYFDLYIKLYKRGKFSKWAAGAQVGDSWLISGPFASHRLPEDTIHYTCIAAGIGIVPFLQLVRQVLPDEGNPIEITLILSNREENDIVGRDELDAYADLYPNRLTVHYVLSEPPSTWSMLKGRIDENIVHALTPDPGEGFHAAVCGPVGFVQNMSVYLRSMGYGSDNIHAFV